MATLEITHLPATVLDQVERIAAEQGLDVSRWAVLELTRIANENLLDGLGDLDLSPTAIVAAVRADRDGR